MRLDLLYFQMVRLDQGWLGILKSGETSVQRRFLPLDVGTFSELPPLFRRTLRGVEP